MRAHLAARALVLCTAAVVLPSTAGLPAGAQQPTAQVVPGMRSLYDIWCEPDGTCLGVGASLELRGAVVVLRANGQHGPVRQLFGIGSLSSIACPPGGGCIAVGGGGNVAAVIEVSRDGTPGVGRAVEGMTELFDVACPTATTCIATGNRLAYLPNWPYHQLTPAFVVITNGVPGPPQDFPRGTRQAVGIDCPTTTRCLVVGRSGFIVLTNLDGRWLTSLHRYTITASSGFPTDEISCPTSTTCYATAVGSLPTPEGAYVWVPAMIAVSADGVAGPIQILSNERGYSGDISCLVGRSCSLAVEGHDPVSGVVIDVFRGTPVAVTPYANSEWFYSLSCIAPATCGVVGNMAGQAVFAWHGPVPG